MTELTTLHCDSRHCKPGSFCEDGSAARFCDSMQAMAGMMGVISNQTQTWNSGSSAIQWANADAVVCFGVRRNWQAIRDNAPACTTLAIHWNIHRTPPEDELSPQTVSEESARNIFTSIRYRIQKKIASALGSLLQIIFEYHISQAGRMYNAVSPREHTQPDSLHS